MQDRFKFRAVLKTDRFTILIEPFYILSSCYFIDINKAEVEFKCKYPDECFWDFVEEIKKQYYIQEISIDGDLIITKDFTNLVQSTGLKDKNGKLIFEGDIVKFAEYDWSDFAFKDWEQEITEIIWCGKHNYPAFDLNAHDFDCNGLAYIFEEGWTIEVIGNIYENKELLGGANNVL